MNLQRHEQTCPYVQLPVRTEIRTLNLCTIDGGAGIYIWKNMKNR